MQLELPTLPDRKTLIPCAVCLRGEYGIDNLCIGVTVLLGKNGLDRIMELDLDDADMTLLNHGAAVVNKGANDLDTFFKPL